MATKSLDQQIVIDTDEKMQKLIALFSKPNPEFLNVKSISPEEMKIDPEFDRAFRARWMQ